MSNFILLGVYFRDALTAYKPKGLGQYSVKTALRVPACNASATINVGSNVVLHPYGERCYTQNYTSGSTLSYAKKLAKDWAIHSFFGYAPYNHQGYS